MTHKPFEIKQPEYQNLVIIDIPLKASFWHAIAFASHKGYRTGKVILQDGSTQTISKDHLVTKMCKEFADLLTVPVLVESKSPRGSKQTSLGEASRQTSLGDVSSLARQTSLGDVWYTTMKFNEPFVDVQKTICTASIMPDRVIEFVSKSQDIQIDVLDREGKRLLRTGGTKFRIILVVDKFGYRLIGQLSKEKVLVTLFPVVLA